MRLSRLISFLLFLSVVGCFRIAPKQEIPVKAPLGKVQEVKVVRDPHLLLVTKLSFQADQIVREAWWVAAAEKRGTSRSPFGKTQRAALLKMDGKLATKGIFQCDRYLVEAVSEGKSWRATMSEKCSDKAEAKIFADWIFDSEKAGHVDFKLAHLAEVLGLGTSIFGQTVTCKMEWSESGILEMLSCPQWEQDLGERRVRFTTFEYKKQNGSLLKLRGQVLEGVEPKKKIEADVPLEGKITVVETELMDPTPEQPVPPPVPVPPPTRGGKAGATPAPEAPPADPTAPPPEAPPVDAAEGEATVDPDVRRQQQKLRQRQSQPPATLPPNPDLLEDPNQLPPGVQPQDPNAQPPQEEEPQDPNIPQMEITTPPGVPIEQPVSAEPEYIEEGQEPPPEPPVQQPQPPAPPPSNR